MKGAKCQKIVHIWLVHQARVYTVDWDMANEVFQQEAELGTLLNY